MHAIYSIDPESTCHAVEAVQLLLYEEPSLTDRMMTGADYIAHFLAHVGCERVFLLTGGTCAFMIDAVARHPRLTYSCVQHEQSAAMAADAAWRVSGRIAATIATSGPGATNLITGIACSFFDSVPSIHITGQVSLRESSAFHGANVRQSGFQETRIVEMVRPITKYAVMVRSTDELRHELAKAYAIATSGRMGPVLIDVPMDVQQSAMEGSIGPIPEIAIPSDAVADVARMLDETLAAGRRPVVLWGGGIGLAGVQREAADWLASTGVPFVSSWAGLGQFDHRHPGFVGQIGVYGNRGANFVLQNADTIIAIGSRLDNRQRSSDPTLFAPSATVHVLDVDAEELKRHAVYGYRTNLLDFRQLPAVLSRTTMPAIAPEWSDYVREMKARYLGREVSTAATRLHSLSPYEVIRRINGLIADDAIVIADTGACMCWVLQAFSVKQHTLFTAGGHSPMGYALPAAIGSKMAAPHRQVISFVGDGGFQLNIQELQTLRHHDLDVILVVMNNDSYGIIKQFQDSYLDSRYTASRDGYSTPDFGRVVEAYGLRHARIERLDQLTADLFRRGPAVVEVVLSEHTLIEPKLEMGRPLNDQSPYLSDPEYAAGNRFVDYPRPAHIRALASP